MYYLVDGGYANTKYFLSPYRGKPYHLGDFEKRCRRQNQYQCSEDMFNHRHAQLRNIVEKTFGILKNHFKIWQWMHKYKFKVQVKIMNACCILHNFIRHQNGLHEISDEDEFDIAVQNNISIGDNSIIGDAGASDSEVGEGLRENIKNILRANR
jgi:DDE superfamily endonuclease